MKHEKSDNLFKFFLDIILSLVFLAIFLKAITSVMVYYDDCNKKNAYEVYQQITI